MVLGASRARTSRKTFLENKSLYFSLLTVKNVVVFKYVNTHKLSQHL